ncbi:MAG: hypothetical protein JW963_04830 [Anaerolineales bacterium]|nr:hypothetical protein [Anaerolineales bacterium]
MKSFTKLASAVLLLAIVLAAFPAMGVSTARAATCDWAQFVADVTVPDGTTYTPGATFRKTWRLKNIGTCTWNTSYSLVFDSGEKMGAPSAMNFPANVAPGQTVDLSVDMTAPSTAGHYFGYWKLRNASGAIFGIGSTANRAFWVEINVGSSAGTGYDFTANAASAAWSSGAGALTFPGTDGDAKGFGVKLDKPKFESGVESGNAGLLMAPQNIYNGYIQAIYPAFRVQSGDRFQATIGCEYGATNCYVAYRLDYQIGSGAVRTFWTFRERYEGLTYNVNLNLNSLAGQDVKFILFVSAYGNAPGDRALWGNPIISRAGGTPPTVTPTVTGTPPTPTPTSATPTRTPTVPPSSCDKVQFISDVTVPDGTTFAPGAAFTKTWRLKNVGSCTWTTSYQLAFYSGEQMSGPSSLNFPQTVAPGQTVDITVSLTAPNTAGSYRGYWMFKNASGALFGIGSQANKPWWVDIKVSGTSGTATHTPTPTATVTGTPPSPTPTFTGTPPTSGCDKAQFVADVTVPDGTTFAPGAAFTKTWRLKNIGSCTWNTSYTLVFSSGEAMGGTTVNFPATVAPGQTVDLSVGLTAPNTAGTYRGYWMLKNASGALFGIGVNANKPFWVEIKVSGSGTGSVAYDFVANYCSAQWFTGSGLRPCPSTQGDVNGYVLKQDSPLPETGVTINTPGLLVAPQNIYNGYIQGIYPALTVQNGDRFRTTIGCQSGHPGCYVTYRLDYRIGGGPVRTFWTFRERYEGRVYPVDLNLSSLAGQNVEFILTVDTFGSSADDHAYWIGAQVYRP